MERLVASLRGGTLAALILTLCTLMVSPAQAAVPCSDSYTAARKMVIDARLGQGNEQKILTKLDNAARMYASANAKGKDNALREVDRALDLLSANATKSIPPAIVAPVRAAVTAYRDCLRGAPVLGIATANVRVFLPNLQNPSLPGASAGDQATVYVDGVTAGNTAADGTLSVKIPATIPVTISAQVYPDQTGAAEVTLGNGAIANVDILLAGDRSVEEPQRAQIDELLDGVWPRTASTFTIRFLDGEKTVAMTEISAINHVDKLGYQQPLPGDFAIGKSGELVARNVTALKAFLADRDDPFNIDVAAYDAEGRVYRDSLRFHYGRHMLTAKLIPPPSTPSLNVGNAFLEFTELYTGLVFRAVSDSTGKIVLPLLPGGEYEVSGAIVSGDVRYTVSAGFALREDLALTLIPLNTSDVLNGVRHFCLCDTNTPPVSPLLFQSNARRRGDIESNVEIVSASVSSGNSPPGTRPAAQSEELVMPKTVEKLILEYHVTSEELAAGRPLATYNDRWSVIVHEAGNLSNWYEKSDQGIATTQFVNGEYVFRQVINVKGASNRPTRNFRVIVSAENARDNQYGTRILAYLETLPEALTVSVTSVNRDNVPDYDGRSHRGQHNFYSIPRPGAKNVWQRYFTLTLETNLPGQPTTFSCAVTRLDENRRPLQSTPARVISATPVGSNKFEVRVTYDPDISTIASTPPPTHEIHYRFDVTARTGTETATATGFSNNAVLPKYGLWRMPDGIPRFGGGGTHANGGDGDRGGDNWASRGTYRWLTEHLDLISRINDISGEHGVNLRHATHAHGSDIDIYQYFDAFPGNNPDPVDPSGTTTHQAHLACAQKALDGDSACRSALISYYNITRDKFDDLIALDSVSQIIHGKGYIPVRTRPSGPRPIALLPGTWSEQLLRDGRFTSPKTGQTLSLGIGEWDNRNSAKMDYAFDHYNHHHITLNRCVTDGTDCPTASAYSCIPAVVDSNPQSQTVFVGDTVTLSVGATGSGPFSYKWFSGELGDVEKEVGSGPTFTFVATQTTTYWAIANNACGSDESQVVLITVNPRCPDVTAQPQSASIVEGEEVTLSFALDGTAPFDIQWYANGSPIAGANSQTLRVAPAATTSYYATARNGCGTDTTATATVTVCNPARITTQPQSVEITRGNAAQLSVSAAGTAPLTYQWFHASTSEPIAGANAATLTVSPTGTTSYFVRITNACGSVESLSATVTVVCTAPSVTQQPASVSVVRGSSATLSVAATGLAPLSYQWFVGSTGEAGTPVPGATSATLTVSPTDTTSYWVRVTNVCGSQDSDTATVTVLCTPPSITTQPQSVSVVEGDSATLSVDAAGTGPLTYQWFSGTTPIGGATSATLTVAPAVTTNYSVVVTNPCGEVTSSTAKVTVTLRCFRPIIGTQPQSATINAGQSVTLSVASSGSDPKSYQWYANGSAVPGANAATFTVSPVTTTNYHVVITNDCGTATSSTAIVTVTSCDLPSITAQPQSLTINAGQNATLTVSATGSGLTYQWFANGSPVAGATNASFTVSPASTTSYHVVVTNACGSVTSSTATVTVNTCTAPVITSQPQSVTVAGGQAATLRVTATGTSLTYQWFTANGSPIPGATGAAYTAAPAGTTSYYVVVSNACGSVTSATATIAVDCQVPVITFQPQSTSIQTGQTVTLFVSANGQQPFSYQWYANGVPVGGTISSSLTVTPSSTTQYYVVVSNVCGSTTSNTATVSVASCLPATITNEPNDATIAPGENVTLSVQASGTGPISYQWRNAAGSVIGTGTTITVSPASSTSYSVRVSNDCGTDTANVSVNVVECPLPVITVHPKSFEIWEGNSSFYEVVATSSTPLSYQWYANGVAMPGVTSRALQIQPTVTTQYFVDVTNSCGTVRSNIGTVTVKPCTKPVITSHPQSVTITDGESATLSATASGTGPITYTLIDQDRNTIASNSTGTFSVRPPVLAPYQWDYWIVAANGCGAEFSSSATVTVLAACTAPSITSQPQSTSIVQGSSATLSVSASGTGPLTIEWFTSGGSPVGSGPSLTVAPSSTTSYYARVTNSCGERTSATATVTVVIPCTEPVIGFPTATVNSLLRYGNFRTLTVTASGSDLQYQWYMAAPAGSTFEPMFGATGPSITVSPDETSDFRVRVFNSCGDVTSAMWHIVMWDGVGDPPDPNSPQQQ